MARGKNLGLTYFEPQPTDAAAVRTAIARGDANGINDTLLGALYWLEDWSVVQELSVEAADQFPDSMAVQYRYFQNITLLTSMRRVPPAALDLPSFCRIATAALKQPTDLFTEVQDAVRRFDELDLCVRILHSSLEEHVSEVRFSLDDLTEMPDSLLRPWTDKDQQAFERDRSRRFAEFEQSLGLSRVRAERESTRLHILLPWPHADVVAAHGVITTEAKTYALGVSQVALELHPKGSAADVEEGRSTAL